MIEENRKYILDKRSMVTVELHDMTKITEWENRVKMEGTAISKFYASWIKIHEAQKLKLLNSNKEEKSNVPTVKRTKRSLDEEEDAEDSEEESEFELRIKGAEDAEEKTEKSSSKIKTKPGRNKKKKAKMNTKDTDNIEEKELEEENKIPDIVENITSQDWD